MLLRHARATRLAATYLVFTIVLMMVPQADIPETLFDEANTPTNDMVIEKAASSWEYRQSVTAIRPKVFVQLRRLSIPRILPVYEGRLTDSRMFRELFCTLLR